MSELLNTSGRSNIGSYDINLVFGRDGTISIFNENPITGESWYLEIDPTNTQIKRYGDPLFDHCQVRVSKEEMPYFLKPTEEYLRKLEANGVPTTYIEQPDKVTRAFVDEYIRQGIFDLANL